MKIFLSSMTKKTWAAISLVSLGIFYLNLLWKTTGDIDSLTTNLLFYSAICALLWRRKDTIVCDSDLASSFMGLSLLTILLIKSTTLFSFEAILVSLIPFWAAISLALISSGIRGIGQYQKELFLAWFLFFSTEVLGNLVDKITQITVLNAKFATYILYYVGFNTGNQGNEVILNLPELGQFRAIVNQPCAGIPMILLMLKLSLLLICFVPLKRKQKIIIPCVSVIIGFFLGVIRVCILTLLIPQPTKFDYWHGSSGNQIFSTLAIVLFAGFAHWVLERKNSIAEVESSYLSEPIKSSQVSK